MSVRTLSSALLVLGLMAIATPVAATTLAIVGARVLPAPDVDPIDAGVVLVREGRIVAVGPAESVEVPADAEVVDARGATLTAGFWNSHVHFLAPVMSRAAPSAPEVLEAALVEMLGRWGFTTVFDLSSLQDDAAGVRARIESGEVAGPAILHVGAPFFPADGTPVYVRDRIEAAGGPSAEVADPAAGAARATRQIADGADGVKLFAGAIVGGEVGVQAMDIAVAQAVAGAARQAGKPVFAHPTNREGLEVALAAGVDVLAHVAPQAGALDATMLERLHAADVALIPTLGLFEVELARERLPPDVVAQVLTTAVSQVRDYAAVGGTLLFGTDVGYIERADTGREYALLVDAGLDWRAILAMLTTAPAARFGQAEATGRVMPGMRADLVLLDGDPTRDPSAFADVRLTLREGRALYRKSSRRSRTDAGEDDGR